MAVTDCLNYGNPEDPEVMGEIVSGIDGIGAACRALETPVVSGNVSLYNTTDGVSIAPTPMIGMVGKHSDVRNAVPAILREKAHIYWLKPKASLGTFGGSLVAKLLNSPVSEGVPELNFEAEKEAAHLIQNLVQEKKLIAARDVASGGVALTLQKMLLPHALGGRFEIPGVLNPRDFNAFAFAEHSASYLLASRDALELKTEHLELVSLGLASPEDKQMSLGPFRWNLQDAEVKSRESLTI